MSTQNKYSLTFLCCIMVLIICAIKAIKSDKKAEKFIGLFNLALIGPLVGNIIILQSQIEILSYIGYMLYYIGMSVVMIRLLRYTDVYCNEVKNNVYNNKITHIIVQTILAFDIIQICLNPIFGHVFKLTESTIEGLTYYKPIPLIGLTYHRIIDYIAFMLSVFVFTVSIFKTSKFYRQKYTVILITMLLSGAVQFYFISSKLSIDRSVLAHSLFGIVCFYFTVMYKPTNLLDTMLVGMASDITDSIYMFDNSNKCVWSNDKGYELLNIKDLSNIWACLLEKFNSIDFFSTEWPKSIHIDKSYYIIEKKLLNNGYFITVHDDTDTHIKLETEKYLATHDSLTGLYNLKYFTQKISEKLKTAKSDQYILIYINIKNFKLINDVFGSKFGDKVLIDFANHLKGVLPKSALYGRMIGDTFGVMLPSDDQDETKALKFLSNFTVTDGSKSITPNFHVGIYLIKDTSLDVNIMLDRAHLASSSITDTYKTIIKHYDDSLRKNILDEQKLTKNLENAIKTNQIQPYLQPITDINGTIVGAEALARWIHPEYGFMPPIKFIPIFEKNGMIVEVDKHIWESACKILSSWKGKYDDLFISINVSPKDFYFVNVAEYIKDLVTKYNISRDKLRIEITETVMMSDPEEKIKIFGELRNEGFIVEMDDFGSGYSSLNMLKDIPIDVLKIDMKFLTGNDTEKAKTVVKNVINLSSDLNLVSLTEGVETQHQYEQLVKMGCSLFQGYYFAKPMPVEEFEKFVESKKL